MHYVKHDFIIEPCFNVVAGYGKFHVIPFSCLHTSGAHCHLYLAVAADLFNGVLRVAIGAEVELAIVLGIYIVEHDNETLRTAVFAGGAMDGVVVRGDDILQIASGASSHFLCCRMPSFTSHEPRTNSGVPVLGGEHPIHNLFHIVC